MPKIPKNPFKRTSKVAGLPLAAAGTSVRNVGRLLRGQETESITEATAREMFSVLGELKGGAMKVGQVLSVMEVALPESMSGPLREQLVRLQEDAPPMEWPAVRDQLVSELGPDWRDRFESFNEEPSASASLGQVHRARLTDGEDVAVKVQYPGAEEAFQSDLAVITRLGSSVGALFPGIDMSPLMAELKERAEEELDYTLEATSWGEASAAYKDDPYIKIPDVVFGTQRVIATTWMTGTPLSRIIADGSQEQRDTMCEAYLRFLVDSPGRCGYLHADPHPGNFRLLDDGRMGVLDFGAVKRLPDGMPPAIGSLLSLALRGDNQGVVDGLRDEGFIKAAVSMDADELMNYLDPFLSPAQTDRFHFTREWITGVTAHVKNPKSPNWSLGLKLNLPPEYLLIHRVWVGALGMMCQMNGHANVLDVFEELLPEFERP